LLKLNMGYYVIKLAFFSLLVQGISCDYDWYSSLLNIDQLLDHSHEEKNPRCGACGSEFDCTDSHTVLVLHNTVNKTTPKKQEQGDNLKILYFTTSFRINKVQVSQNSLSINLKEIYQCIDFWWIDSSSINSKFSR
jgi:hypothetical protein